MLDLQQHVPDRLAQRHPTPVGNVIDLIEYRCQKLACSSAKPHAFVQGYLLAGSVSDLVSRQVDKLIDRGHELLRGLRCP